MSSPNTSEMDIPTICFGFTLGFMVLTGAKVSKQSISIWKRTKSIWNLYTFMIWVELLVCLAWAISAWLFLRGNIKGSFGFYFYIATLWTIQTQFLLQIIANRIGLVMTSRRSARILKLSLLLAVGLINISVYIIWIPARMEISPAWIHLNEIWDRIEKVIYLLMDLGLNCYFLWIVRNRLIARGLTKYTTLFRFNAGIVGISIAMDALIIGMMSLPNTLVYTQFHSLAYIVKLNIELSMADLISKVVRRQDRTDKPHSYSGPSSHPSKGTELTSKTRTNNFTSTTKRESVFQSASQAKGGAYAGEEWGHKRTNVIEGNIDDAVSDSSSDSGMNFRMDPPQHGIVKTVAVETVVNGERRRESTSSSTAQLNEYIPQSQGRLS